METSTQTTSGAGNAPGKAGPLAPRTAEELMMFASQLQTIRRDVDALVAGLTDEQFNWRPSADRWSIAQCLQHLNVAGTEMLHAQSAAIDQARMRSMVSDGPYAYGRIGTMLLDGIEPPPRRRFKTSKRLIPAEQYQVAAVLAEFLKKQDRIGDTIRRARGLDLARVKVPLPGIPFVKLGLGQSLAFLLGHERRHLWQAKQVREHPEFPRGGA